MPRVPVQKKAAYVKTSPGWLALAHTVLGIDEPTARKIWHVMTCSTDTDARALCYAMERPAGWRCNGLQDHRQRLVLSLLACEPKRMVKIIERLVAANLLSFHEGNEAMEAFLRRADQHGKWQAHMLARPW